MNPMIRIMMGGIGLTVVAFATVPTPSLACPLDEWSGFNIAIPPNQVLNNEESFNGTEKHVKGESRRNQGTFKDNEILLIEGFPNKVKGYSQERVWVRAEDRIADVKTWVDEWVEQNETYNNSHP